VSNKILAPISVGELLDKISILEIKESFAQDKDKLKNIRTELAELRPLCAVMSEDVQYLYHELKAVNQDLWHIEDYKRSCEKDKNFGDGFVSAARQVYIKNDHRAALKRQINLKTNSVIIEEKIY
jgi:uncharacterized coiled-coil protein SlyX